MLFGSFSNIAFPVLVGWQYITLISPVFIFFLLTRISGIPMLESKADKKWGNHRSYGKGPIGCSDLLSAEFQSVGKIGSHADVPAPPDEVLEKVEE